MRSKPEDTTKVQHESGVGQRHDNLMEIDQTKLLLKPDPAPTVNQCMPAFLTAACRVSGSVLFDAKWYVVAVVVWAYLAVYLHRHHEWNDVSDFSEHAFREVGVAMSFLLVHRATVAYNIFWESRGAIGALAHECRALIRRVSCCTILCPPDKQDMAAQIREGTCRRCVLIFTAQRLKLEGAAAAEVEKVLSPFLQFEKEGTLLEEMDAFNALSWISVDVCRLLSEGKICGPTIEGVTTKLDSVDGALACFDKLATKFPEPYEQLLSFGILVFVAILPLPFVDDWHWYIAIPVTASSAFLFGIEFLARRLYNPFSLNGSSPGIPFFSMRAMGFKLQADAWKTVAMIASSDREIQM